MGGWQSEEGAAAPLGVVWLPEEGAYNFALYSKHAEWVRLQFYREENLETPCHAYDLDWRRNKTNRIWHCRLLRAKLKGAAYYAYRVGGPRSGPGFGYDYCDFDGEKLLLDPYARAVFIPPSYDRGAACRPGSNEGRAPLGVLSPDPSPFDWEGDRPIRHESELVVYELHVRGFTRDPNSGVTEAHRGTYEGVIEKIPYLVDLGVTAVELMPVHQFDPQEGSYWGYMTLNFFAPHHGYAASRESSQQRDEFRRMVRELHKAGIEVILDVVYNHTTEGDHRGPCLSLKGIDSSTYYLINRDNGEHPYNNATGTGNTLHTANRAVSRLVSDSLRYWVEEMHVDGFRFDLGSIFARRSDGTLDTEEPPIFAQIASDPVLSHVRLIAEPWDPGAYLVGRNFPGSRWMQWNDRFRRTIRRAIRGESAQMGDLMTRLYGSTDLFPHSRFEAFRPWHTLNYAASHDGFSMCDLVSYNAPVDDHEDEQSWDCGWHGELNAPAEVIKLRKQQVKNLCVLTLLANGTPMIRMGDEFMQTQEGRRNPYNQDNQISWLNWDRLQAFSDVHRFFKKAIALRKGHPLLGTSRFWEHPETLQFYGTAGEPDWRDSSRTLAYCLRGSDSTPDLYVMVNMYWEPVRFSIQEQVGGWERVLDTSLEPPHDFADPGQAIRLTSAHYTLNPRSVVVLTRR